MRAAKGAHTNMLFLLNENFCRWFLTGRKDPTGPTETLVAWEPGTCPYPSSKLQASPHLKFRISIVGHRRLIANGFPGRVAGRWTGAMLCNARAMAMCGKG